MAAVAISHTVWHVQVVVLDDEVRIIVTVALGHTVAVAVLAGILWGGAGGGVMREGGASRASGTIAGRCFTRAVHRAVALIGGFYRHDEVVAVSHHHVGDLVQWFPGHVDTIHLENLVVDSQQPRALCQTAFHEARDEDAGNFLHPLRSDADTDAITDVKAEGFVGAVLVQADTEMRVG